WNPDRPAAESLALLRARWGDGQREPDFRKAITGYERRHGREASEGFDPIQHFRAQTVFRPTKFDAYLEDADAAPPRRSGTAKVEIHDVRAMVERRARERAVNEPELRDEPRDPRSMTYDEAIEAVENFLPPEQRQRPN
ncbi:MAG: hypothetical protein ACPGWS_09245, partial [Solirubrobacterales bacterium]